MSFVVSVLIFMLGLWVLFDLIPFLLNCLFAYYRASKKLKSSATVAVPTTVAEPTEYFIRHLTAEQKDLLNQKSVHYSDSVTDGDQGVVIEKGQESCLAGVLGATFFCVQQHDYWELVLIPTSPPDDSVLRDFSVSISGVSYPLSDHLERLTASLLLNHVRSNIIVHFMHGRTVEPPVDDTFHIFICSSVVEGLVVSTPERIWGLPVGSRGRSSSPSGRGLALVDDSTGYVVAELVDNSLYVHLDLFLNSELSQRQGKGPDQAELAVFARLLQQVQGPVAPEKYLREIVEALTLPIPESASETSFTVTAAGFTGLKQTIITNLITNVLVPFVAKDVVVERVTERNQNPIVDGKFHVFFNSSPTGTALIEVPEMIWGYQVARRGKAFLPSGLGLPIMDESGFMVAELLDDNLYVNHLLHLFGSRSEARYLARLLKEVINELSVTPEQVAKRFEDECYRRALSSLTNNQPADRASRAQALQSKQRELHKFLRDCELELQKFYQLESAPNDEFGREFDQLLAIPEVTNVRVSNNSITVGTDLLYCVDPRDNVTHEIGAFDINIPLAADRSMTWDNRTRKVEGYQANMNAPHVFADRTACLGNAENLLNNLRAERQFAAVARVAILFVQSVNVNDAAGKFVDNWPIAAYAKPATQAERS